MASLSPTGLYSKFLSQNEQARYGGQASNPGTQEAEVEGLTQIPGPSGPFSETLSPKGKDLELSRCSTDGSCPPLPSVEGRTLLVLILCSPNTYFVLSC